MVYLSLLFLLHLCFSSLFQIVLAVHPSSVLVRVRASCAHFVNPVALRQWVTWALQEQAIYKFFCPRCRRHWLWQEVRKLALLNEHDRNTLEQKIIEVTETLFDPPHRKCPRCGRLVERFELTNLCTPCLVCSERTARVYRFCWACLKDWSGPSPRNDSCASPLCASQAALLSCLLVTAALDSEVNGCPSLRACPNCEALVTHTLDGSVQVQCPNCGLYFCYRCLGRNGDHHGIAGSCIMSPRQNLTGRNWSPVDYFND
nr:PREDICTED: uncharacterized protein LOC106706315 isoform X1 [Latimeria chalumnae]|eukprot:XP_014352566.1 PREDICTED: uncharacterized protein LOC106706315 isoform X1 [Latimeria chalumnae]